MRINLLSVAALTTTLLAALVRAPAARADDDRPHKLGDHPAVIVQRLHKAAGYDYASKFYPHPAWLRLYATQPNEGAELAATADGASESRPTPVQSSVTRESASEAPRIRIRPHLDTGG